MKARDYQNLILDSINDEIKAPTYQDLMKKVRDIFESEMIHKNNSPNLQELASRLMQYCEYPLYKL